MDFRLKVFTVVAKHLSFTKAGKELSISQPAITKHIQELENLYRIQLFERAGGKISLTHQGAIFLKYATYILNGYDSLSNEMALLEKQYEGEFKIGASPTVAQYLLPSLAAGFIKHFPKVKFTLLTANSRQVEEALENHSIELGIVEGTTRNENLHYSHFMKDKLVIVTSSLTKVPDTITSKELANLPIVLEENGSGTLEIIGRKLFEAGIKLSDLNMIIQLGSAEGIKRFLAAMENSYAIVSAISVADELKSNRLKVVDIEDILFEREFAFVSKNGRHNDKVEKFKEFAISTISSLV